MTKRYLATLFLLTGTWACGADEFGTAQTRNPLTATDSKALSGCYEPVRGRIRATAYTQIDALGRFTLLATRRNWQVLTPAEKRATRRVLVLKSELKGTIDPTTGLASHVITPRQRNGLLFTTDDTFVPSNTGCFLEGVQTLNYTQGVGQFAALATGQLIMDGSINGCPDDPEAGFVTFDVRPGEGELCFGEP